MRLKVIDTNFTNEIDWLFKLTDVNNAEYFIKESEFYSSKGLLSPVTRQLIDSLDIGFTLNCEYEKIDNQNIILEIK